MKTLGKVCVAVTAAIVLFVAGMIYAQDVAKVGADSHTVLLENDQVRVLKVDLKPGQKVPMHSHPHNVAYYLSDAKVRIILPDGKSQERDIKAGTSSWSEATAHAVENIGTTELQEVQIELKK